MEMKGEIMKNINRIKRIIQGPTLALASMMIIGVAWAGNANTQNRAFDDGIAASPKVRAGLDERKTKIAVVKEKGTVSTMPCAQCTDVLVSSPLSEPKGLGARTLVAKGTFTKPVAKHLCPACETKWQVSGVGKARQAVAVHTCGQTAKKLTCCSTVSAKH